MSDVVNVSMKTLLTLLTTFSPNVTVCIRGRHAVGKSEGTYQAAARLRSDFYLEPTNVSKYNWSYDQGLPVVERRLSQLTEGDLTGMPDLSPDRKSTAFKPCDWFIDACERPVVLFLDERNRALEGVKQTIFQIMDSRAFYGYKLHPETRVVVAENVGELYAVQQCDPAEVSRAATVELAPTVEEWLEYATGRCHPCTVDFIRANPETLEFIPGNKKVYEPGKKYPDRRSWFKLDHELQVAKLFEEKNNSLLYALAASMLGVEAAIRFAEYVKTYSQQIQIADILNNWELAKVRLGQTLTQQKYIELAKKLSTELSVQLTNAQAKQLGQFMADLPAEGRMIAFAGLQANRKNLLLVHPYIEELMVNTATGVAGLHNSKKNKKA